MYAARPVYLPRWTGALVLTAVFLPLLLALLLLAASGLVDPEFGQFHQQPLGDYSPRIPTPGPRVWSTPPCSSARDSLYRC